MPLDRPRPCFLPCPRCYDFVTLNDTNGGKTMHDEQPGDREAAGAIEGMVETYGAHREPVTEGIPLDLLVTDPTELD